MSKHLTPYDIGVITKLIDKSRGKITWPKIRDKIEINLGYRHSEFTLMRNPIIKAAFVRRKNELKVSKEGHLAKVAVRRSELRHDKVSHISQLEAENQYLKELVATLLENATKIGIPIQRMERPPNPVDYNSTPKRD
jgi:hypothetical protein